MTTKQGEARQGKTHKPLMPSGLLTLVVPAITQALMAEKQEEAKEQMEHRETTATRPHVRHGVAGERAEAPKAYPS